MMLQRSFSHGAAAGRIQPLRGSFALEPVAALPRLSERIALLAERALEPNPFLLPQFLGPAMQALGSRRLRLAVFSDRDDLHFFAPVVVYGGRFLSAPKLRGWTHAYAPLGVPLIDAEAAAPVADSLMAYLKASGRGLLNLPELPLRGPTARVLRAAAERHGFAIDAQRQMRPILDARHDRAIPFDRMLSQKRRHELDRQLRRLCESGPVSFMSARTPSELDAAFGMFAALEASGWKGRRGTALSRRRAIHDFAHVAILQMAQSGQAGIDVLRVGDRPVAALVRLESCGLSVPWKVAYDESFAAFSPGKQLMCDVTRRWLADSTTCRVDPVCEEDNPLIASLWKQREPYGTLLISPRRWGIGARLRAGLMDLRTAARRQARDLLRGRRRRRAVRTRGG